MTLKKLDYLYLVIFAAGAAAMFMPSGSSPPGLRSSGQLWNLGHAGLFFLAGHLVYTFLPGLSRKPIGWQAFVFAAIALAAGGATELLQTLISGRTASFFDVVINLAGMGACVSLKNLGKTGKHLMLHAAVACLVALALWPLIRSLSDEVIAGRQFPVLADFETPFETDRFQSDTAKYQITAQKAFSGTKSLKVGLGTDTYSGIFLTYMPCNWKSFSWFKFHAYNPQDFPVSLTVRIHDREHETGAGQLYTDRFNKSFCLAPQRWSAVIIPLADVHQAPSNRQMNMSLIQSIGFFVTRPTQPLTLFIDNIMLMAP